MSDLFVSWSTKPIVILSVYSEEEGRHELSDQVREAIEDLEFKLIGEIYRIKNHEIILAYDNFNEQDIIHDVDTINDILESP